MKTCEWVSHFHAKFLVLNKCKKKTKGREPANTGSLDNGH